MAQLLTLESMDPDRDISIYINSPGGSFTALTAIYDTMQFVRPDIQTICLGQAASAAAIIIAAGFVAGASLRAGQRVKRAGESDHPSRPNPPDPQALDFTPIDLRPAGPIPEPHPDDVGSEGPTFIPPPPFGDPS
jgi:hypothetical protein